LVFSIEEKHINFEELERKLFSDYLLLRNLLINCADLALYDAKGKYGGEGRNRVKIFDPAKKYNGT
jgi:GGDEF domain-containing protein